MACTGNPDCSEYEGNGEGLCYDCGCDWDFGMCFGSPDPCSSHTSSFECEDCLCDWTEPSLNIKINIADSWKDVEELKINVGDVWKTVTEVWINVGDVWKRVF